MSTEQSKPILICYDGSTGADRAVTVAADLFPGRRAIVLNVWSPISIIVAAYGNAVALPSYDDDVLQEAATKVAAKGTELAVAAGLAAQPEIAENAYQGTAHVVLEVAGQYDADVIVAGARGLSGFKSFVLGSVSHSIAQHAHVPVLIVPPTAEAEAGAEPAQAAAARA